MFRKISKFFIPAAIAAIAYVLIKHVEITATVEVDTEDEE